MRLKDQNPLDDIEKTVLGACLLDKATALDIAEIVTQEMFSTERHRLIYGTVLGLITASKAVDIVLVAQALGNRLSQAGGHSYLTELTNYVATTQNATDYANQLRDRWARRRLKALAAEASARADSPEGLEQILEETERAIFDLSHRGPRPMVRFGEAAFTHWEGLYGHREQRGITGLSTGYGEIDTALGGLQRGDLIIVAGRPSSGKTALGLCIMLNAGRKGQRGLMFSMEMSIEQISERVVCAQAPINSYLVRQRTLSKEHWDRAFTAAGKLPGLPLWVDDNPDLTTLQARARARRLAATEGLDFVVVDYLQLLADKRPPGTSRAEQVGQMTRAMKAMARELRVPVLLLCQMNRGIEVRQDKVPQLSDLRESGAIEQDADVVMFVHRPEMYDRDIKPGVAEIHIAKQRNGPIGVLELAFHKDYARFDNLVREEGHGSHGYRDD